jgi:hypothetical protein
VALGFPDDENEWDLAMTGSTVYTMPKSNEGHLCHPGGIQPGWTFCGST